MKPILHLLGDKYKAQQFVRFAERKLDELKRLMLKMNQNMQNRLYQFATDDVEVYIESYRGVDKIRISAIEERRKCPGFAGTSVLGGEVLEGESILEVTLGYGVVVGNRDLEVGTRNSFKHIVVDFGDSTFAPFRNLTSEPLSPVDINNGSHLHNYEAAGIFSPKFSFGNTPIWEYLDTVTPIPVLSNIEFSLKGSGNHTLEADAWAEYLTSPWNTVSPSQGIRSWHYLDRAFSGKYQYSSKKINFDLDLTGYESTVTNSTPRIYIGIEFQHIGDHNNVPHNSDPNIQSGGVETSLGGSIERIGASSGTGGFRAIHRILDVTDYSGTIASGIEIRDNTEYERETVMPEPGSYNGWRTQNQAGIIHRELAPICSTTRDNYITVT